MSERRTISPLRGPLTGSVRVPGDKSIAQRALLLAAAAEGESRLFGLPVNDDVCVSVTAIRSLGAEFEVLASTANDAAVADVEGSVDAVSTPDTFDCRVVGWGSRGPAANDSSARIDCRESATLARMITGLLSRYPGSFTIDGDDSLRRRPFVRVTEPLHRMGAAIEGNALPLAIRGVSPLRPIDYKTPVASAQVKTAILLAGLGADGRTLVEEPSPSRNHTEKMLHLFGASCEFGEGWAAVDGPCSLNAADLRIPGDPSSAAFLLAAAALRKDSELVIEDLCLNPIRLGYLRAFEKMGIDVEVRTPDSLSNAKSSDDPRLSAQWSEPVGSVRVRHTSRLRPIEIAPEEVPSLIDELPLLSLMAALADGTSVFCGVDELRLKESNRLEAIVEGLNALGMESVIRGDSLLVHGSADWSPHPGATLDARGDHRMAMTWALAGLCFDAPVDVVGFDSIGKSFPSFLTKIERLQG